MGIARVLIVLSAASEMELADGTSRRIGYWAEEVAIPHRALVRAGYDVDIASPGGVPPTADPASLGNATVERYLASVEGLAKPIALESLDADALAGYAAVVVPGGYAPMVDLARSPHMARVLASALRRNVPIAAICHGPAALLSLEEKGKPWAFAGRRMAAFTNAEEDAWLKGRKLRWNVETELRKAGAKVETAPPWKTQVVVDGNLITAQSSPSTRAFTEALLAALAANPPARREGGGRERVH